MNWFDLVLRFAVPVIGAMILQALKTPKDHERASLLAQLAKDAAATVVGLMPDAAWPQLLQAVIAQLAAIVGVPTKNTAALERAATAALMALGKKP